METFHRIVNRLISQNLFTSESFCRWKSFNQVESRDLSHIINNSRLQRTWRDHLWLVQVGNVPNPTLNCLWTVNHLLYCQFFGCSWTRKGTQLQVQDGRVTLMGSRLVLKDFSKDMNGKISFLYFYENILFISWEHHHATGRFQKFWWLHPICSIP